MITNPIEILAYLILQRGIRRILKNEPEKLKVLPKNIIEYEHEKRRSKALRDYYCSIIKKIRKLYPYVVNQEYRENKKIYDEQLKIVNDLKVIDWITVISNSFIEKGYNKFNEYNKVETFDNIGECYQISRIDNKYNYIDVYEYGSLYYGMFRKATVEEIKKTKEKMINDIYLEIEDENENHREKINKLYDKIKKLKNREDKLKRILENV